MHFKETPEQMTTNWVTEEFLSTESHMDMDAQKKIAGEEN